VKFNIPLSKGWDEGHAGVSSSIIYSEILNLFLSFRVFSSSMMNTKKNGWGRQGGKGFKI